MKRTLAILLLVALATWAMKRYYAEAPVDELQWILGPTATLVTALTRVSFEWEPGKAISRASVSSSSRRRAPGSTS